MDLVRFVPNGDASQSPGLSAGFKADYPGCRMAGMFRNPHGIAANGARGHGMKQDRVTTPLGLRDVEGRHVSQGSPPIRQSAKNPADASESWRPTLGWRPQPLRG